MGFGIPFIGITAMLQEGSRYHTSQDADPISRHIVGSNSRDNIINLLLEEGHKTAKVVNVGPSLKKIQELGDDVE